MSIGKTTGEVGFYGFVGTTIPPYKAYLTCNWVGSTSRSLSVVIDDEIDEATGIIDINHSPLTIDHSAGAVYDLQGRCVRNGEWSKVNGQLPKGLYIKNGKKVVVSRLR